MKDEVLSYLFKYTFHSNPTPFTFIKPDPSIYVKEQNVYFKSLNDSKNVINTIYFNILKKN